MAALPSLLRQHLRLYQLIGYLPLPLRPPGSRRIECLQRLWSIALLSAYSCVTVVVLTSDDVYLFSADTFGYFNDTMKLSAAQLAITLSYAEALLCRESLRRFWRIHARLLAAQPAGDAIWWRQLWQYRRYLLPCYAIMAVELLALLLFCLLQEPMTRHLLLFWSMFWPFIYAVRLRGFQCNLHMELIRQQLLALARDLRLLAQYTCGAAQRQQPLAASVRCALLEKQRRYQLIYELYVQFQRALGHSLLAVLLMVYVRVLVDTYFFYYTVYRGWCTAENFLILPTIAEIPILLLTAKACMDAVDEVAYQLHSIHSGLQANVSRQLQNFSLQIIHQRLRIDGAGVQRLDGYMLTKAITSITTYMIFFVQFMPKLRRF